MRYLIDISPSAKTPRLLVAETSFDLVWINTEVTIWNVPATPLWAAPDELRRTRVMLQYNTIWLIYGAIIRCL